VSYIQGGNEMGFGDARAGLAVAIGGDACGHWPRKDSYTKNWLQHGRVSPVDVQSMLLRCNGTQHRESGFVSEPGVRVHEFFPEWRGVRWYLKAYYHADQSRWILMSVHPAEV
jgi:hypothetical protein